jgi:hypothetical protein
MKKLGIVLAALAVLGLASLPVFTTPAKAQNKKAWEGFWEEVQKAMKGGSAPAPAKK